MLTAKGPEARHIALCEQLCMLQTWAERRHVSILQCGVEGIENQPVRAVADSVNVLHRAALDA